MHKCYHAFTRPTALEAVMLRETVEVAAQCHERGWTAGTAGNFSVRSRPSLVWMSPSGVCKGGLTWDRFVPVDLESCISFEALYRKPSDETELHAAILRAHPLAKSVVHAHPPHLVAASMSRDQLTFAGWEMQKVLGVGTHLNSVRIATEDNTQDIRGFARAFRFTSDLHVLVLRGHGVYAWGPSPQSALNLVEGLEQLCHTSHLV